GWTNLLIQPPYRFRAVDALLTNFHLPASTLLALVMALAGVELTRRAYDEAIRAGYRFYSYRDPMLVVWARPAAPLLRQRHQPFAGSDARSDVEPVALQLRARAAGRLLEPDVLAPDVLELIVLDRQRLLARDGDSEVAVDDAVSGDMVAVHTVVNVNR